MPNWIIHIIANIATTLIILPYTTTSITIILTQKILSNLIDLDHLNKKPIYQKNRCSINYHTLHKTWQIPIYALLLITPLKWLGIGILTHLALDYIECHKK